MEGFISFLWIIFKKGWIMSDIVIKVVEVLIEKLGGDVFDGFVKFEIEGEGVIVIDSDGVCVSDDDIDVILMVDVDIF